MKQSGYGFYLSGMKPSDFIPDYEMCTGEEIERHQRDREKEKRGETDFEYNWGIGIYQFDDDIFKKD